MSQRGPQKYYYDSDSYWGPSGGGYSSGNGHSYPYSGYRTSSYYGQYPYSDYSYSDSYNGRQGSYAGYYGQYPYDDYNSMYDQSGYMDEYGEGQYGYDGAYGNSSLPSGVAIAGLVLGLVCLLFCWMPVLNNFIFIIAVVGFFLSLFGVIATVMRKRSGKGIAISALILNSLAIAGVIITQSILQTNLIEQFQKLGEGSFQLEDFSFSSAINSFQIGDATVNFNVADSTVLDDLISPPIDSSSTNIAEEPAATVYETSGDGFSAKLMSYTFMTDISGNPAILAEVSWRNDSNEPKTASEMVSIAAYQNGAVLAPAYVNGADTFGSRNKDVVPNAESIFYAAFELIDSSEVTIKGAGLGSTGSAIVFETVCVVPQ